MGWVLVAIGVVLILAGQIAQRRLLRGWRSAGVTASKFTSSHGLKWLSQGIVGVTGLALLIIGLLLTLR